MERARAQVDGSAEVAPFEADALRESYEALRRVATLVAQGAEPNLVFETVVKEVALLLGAEFGVMRRYLPERCVRDVALWSRSTKPYPPISEEPVPLGGRNVSTLVFDSGMPARVDSYGEDAGAAAAPAIAAGNRSTVGAPVMVEGRLWGVLAVSWTHEQPLPAETDPRLAGFAELVGTTIANADARDELQRVAAEQAALRRVATLVAHSATPADVFAAVAQELRNLLGGADVAMIVRFEPDGTATVVAGVCFSEDITGVSWKLEPDGPIGSVFQTGALSRYEESAPPPPDTSEGELFREHQIRSEVVCPITVNSRLWGAVAVASRTVLLFDDAEQRLADFTELVAVAISNAEDRSELTASRARIVTAADETRRRIERDLHDGIQQRLIRLAFALRTSERQLRDDVPEVRESVASAAAELSDVLVELQEISRGIHPPVLVQGGLGPALRTLGRRTTSPVEVAAGTEERLPEHVEVAAYYVVAEALANVAKHAHASRASVEFDVKDDVLTLQVRDDGIGGANARRGSGLVGIADRVQALGGAIEIESPTGEGTTLRVKLPVDGDGAPPG
jgi:signal transduction histidine kinase